MTTDLESKVAEISGKSYRIIISMEDSEESGKEYQLKVQQAIKDSVPIIIATGESCCSYDLGDKAYSMLEKSDVELLVTNSCMRDRGLTMKGETKVVTFHSFDLRDALLADYTTGEEMRQRSIEMYAQEGATHMAKRVAKEDAIRTYTLRSRLLKQLVASVTAGETNRIHAPERLSEAIAQRIADEKPAIDALATVLSKYDER